MRTIIKAIIKIIALVFVLQLLSPFVSHLSYLSNSYIANFGYQWVYIGSMLILLIIAALLIYFGWFKVDKIANLLVRNLDENQLAISTTNLDLIKVVMCFFGIWLIIKALPDLLGLLSYHTYWARYLIPGVEQDPGIVSNEIKELVIQSITLVIGIFLLFGNSIVAKGLVNLWKYGSFKEDKDTTQE